MTTASTPELTWHTELTPAENTALRSFLLAVRAADRRPMVSDTGPLPGELRGGEYLFAVLDGELVGVAHLDLRGDSFGRKIGEFFVHPNHRGHGVGGAIVAELTRRAAIAQGSRDRLRVWSHGDDPAAAALAEKYGFTKVRQLLRMRLDLSKLDEHEPQLPEGVELRTFVPGTDENAVVEVNRKAFDWHPEQSQFSVATLLTEENEPWFDANGFFLAENSDRVVGFHWTKVHDEVVADQKPQRTGEVYVVGVDPAAQGTGLGKALTLAGLNHLAKQGLKQAMLYVESDNTTAIRVYERLGFEVWDADVQYAK